MIDRVKFLFKIQEKDSSEEALIHIVPFICGTKQVVSVEFLARKRDCKSTRTLFIFKKGFLCWYTIFSKIFLTTEITEISL